MSSDKKTSSATEVASSQMMSSKTSPAAGEGTLKWRASSQPPYKNNKLSRTIKLGKKILSSRFGSVWMGWAEN